MNTSKRLAEKTDNSEVTIYKIKWWAEYDKTIKPLIDRCSQIVARIQSGSIEVPWKWWVRTVPVDEQDKKDLAEMKDIFTTMSLRWWRGGKNVLHKSKRNDTTVGFWKDNRVFWFSGSDKFVYKQSSEENASPEQLLYLRRKYEILKTYLWDLIPQTRFVLWETNEEARIAKWIPTIDKPQMNIITIQRKINGENLKKLPRDVKNQPDFLTLLEKAHRKYILLKMFVRRIAEESWFFPDTIDVKMDLWPLSDMDRFDTQDPISIRKNLTSPNIMYDGKSIYFIDLDFGKWTEEKQKVFDVLMMPETIQRWDEALGSFWLVE